MSLWKTDTWWKPQLLCWQAKNDWLCHEALDALREEPGLLVILQLAAREVRNNWSETSCPASRFFALDPAAQRLALAAWGGSVETPPKRETLEARKKPK